VNSFVDLWRSGIKSHAYPYSCISGNHKTSYNHINKPVAITLHVQNLLERSLEKVVAKAFPSAHCQDHSCRDVSDGFQEAGPGTVLSCFCRMLFSKPI